MNYFDKEELKIVSPLELQFQYNNQQLTTIELLCMSHPADRLFNYSYFGLPSQHTTATQ